MKNNLFQIVILAGGLATRLHPVTKTIPKALVNINEEPFINHQLRLLLRHGVREVVLCVGHLGDMIERHVGDGRHFGMHVQYSYDGPKLAGTAGAIKQALRLLRDAFFVLYGDSYLTCDYAAMQAAFQKDQKRGLMAVFRNAGQWDNSNIEYTGGKIIAYDKEKRTERMHHIDYGVGILTKEAFTHLPDPAPYDLAQLYQRLLKDDQLAAYEVDKRFYEIGSFAGIKELEYYLSRKETVLETVE